MVGSSLAPYITSVGVVFVIPRLQTDLINALAPLSRARYVTVHELTERLASVIVESAQSSAARVLAAEWVSKLCPLAETTSAIVREVLLADVAVVRQVDLVPRIGRRIHQIRYAWRRDTRRSSRMRLLEFCRWGRALRVIERMGSGGKLRELAIEWDIDESSLYRDLRLVSADARPIAANLDSHTLLDCFQYAFRKTQH